MKRSAVPMNRGKGFSTQKEKVLSDTATPNQLLRPSEKAATERQGRAKELRARKSIGKSAMGGNSHTQDKKRWHGELLQFYADNGITCCEWEGCNSTFGVAPAHCKKQRFLRDRTEYFRAAYLCTVHHHWAEYGDKKNPGTHERMDRLIAEVIKKRGTT